MFVTTHVSKSAPRKPWGRKKKYAVVGGALAAIAVPTAAWAAINLYGFGNFESGAATVNVLTVDSTEVTGPLLPGGKTGAKGIVRNTNNFPITVKYVIVKKASAEGTGAGCDQSKLTLLGTPLAYPTEDGGGDGMKQAIAEEVDIAPGGAAWITVPESVSQASDATALCGIKGRFAVVASNKTS